MRNLTRILAMILLALMLVGMFPFALFAEEGTATDIPADDSNMTYAEKVAAHAASQGGKFLYGHDFEGLDFNYSNLGETGMTLDSLNGGTTLTLAPKADTFKSEDGAIHYIGKTVEGLTGNSDALIQMSPSGAAAGKNLVIEVSYKVDGTIDNGTNLLFMRQDNWNGKGATNRLAMPLIIAYNGNYTTGVNKKALAPLDTDTYHDFKVVCKLGINTAFYYVDGVYVGTDMIANANLSQLRTGVIDPGMIRPLMTNNKNIDEGMYIDNFYVYTANSAYGVEDAADDFLAGTLANYLSETGNRLLFGMNFDENTTYQGDDKPITSLTPGTVIYDKNYDYLTGNYTNVVTGTSWTFRESGRIFATSTGGFANRLTVATATIDEGRSVLAVDHQYPTSKHVHLDTNLLNYKVGTSMIGTITLKRYEGSQTTEMNILQWRWNSFGNGETGTAADGSTATRSNSGFAYFGNVVMKSDGSLVMYDYSKNPDGDAVKVGQLTSTEYTTLSVAYDWANNCATVYINGYKTAEIGTVIKPSHFKSFTVNGVEYFYDDFSSAEFPVASGRTDLNQAATGSYWGGLYIDDMAVYTGTVPYEYKGEETPDGWTQVGDYWRYYENGVALIGEQVIAGETYYFEKEGAFVSQMQRDSIVDLYATFKQAANGDHVTYIAESLNYGPTVAVEGSGPYTYLWGDLYRAGKKDNSQAIFNVNSNLKQNYKMKRGTVPFSNKAALLATGNPEEAYNSRMLYDNKDYINLNGYVGMQIVSYVEGVNNYTAEELAAKGYKMSGFGFYLIVSNDNWSTSLPGYTSLWHGVGFSNTNNNKPSGYNTLVRYDEDGWHTTSFYFATLPGSYRPSGMIQMGDSRNGSPNRISEIRFNIDWGSTATDFDFTDTKMYIDGL